MLATDPIPKEAAMHVRTFQYQPLYQYAFLITTEALLLAALVLWQLFAWLSGMHTLVYVLIVTGIPTGIIIQLGLWVASKPEDPFMSRLGGLVLIVALIILGLMSGLT